MFVRIITLLWVVTLLVQPAVALAANKRDVNQFASSPQQSANTSLKIGVLLPKDGAIATYENSLQRAIDFIEQQLQLNPAMPRVEFVSGNLSSSDVVNRQVMADLVAQEIDAIIAPNLLSALITASPNQLDVLPLVARASQTSDLTFVGENSLYSHLSEHPVIVRTIQQLKFRGGLNEVILMHDPANTFGRLGYDVAVDVLSQEQISFSTEIFDSENIDFFDKLEQVKLSAPKATVIIVAKTADVADVIIQAHDEIGLLGHVIGLIGDGNPAIYDLADGISGDSFEGVAWDVIPSPLLSGLVARQFGKDQFAAQSYIAIWSVLLRTNEGYTKTPAGIRNAFIDHGDNYLEQPATDLATWIYRALGSSLTALYPASVAAPLTTSMEQLSLTQIAPLEGSISADLE